MKTQDVRGKSGFYSTSTASINGSYTEPPECKSSRMKRGNYLKQAIFICVPLLLFVILGFYFLSLDVKTVAVTSTESNTSSVTWAVDFTEDTTPIDNNNTTEPINETEINDVTTVAQHHPKETIILFPKGNETEFVIKEQDDYDDDFTDFVKIINASLAFAAKMGTPSENIFHEKDPLTTPKGFHYSATIPKNDKPTDATLYMNATSEPNCFSTRIPFCEGVLPYDMVQLPSFASIKSKQELDAMLPYFQLIVQSGCSVRARDFICSILEPECRPVGSRPPAPCKLSCKVLAKDCKEFLMETLPLSRIFDCRRYPDSDENQECLNLSKGSCFANELKCPDGTCIPSDWVCDGVHDCPGTKPSLDERNCGAGCSSNEFRCILDGKCVPDSWHCDGQLDCIDGSDETSC